MSPYRTHAARAEESADGNGVAAHGCPDADLAPILFPFWLASVARVLVGIVRHEAFGLDASLATISLVLVPFLLRDTAVWCLRRLAATARTAWFMLGRPFT